ncbi:hypothetical protein SPONN_2150 [uncultured Candidatus Thioglobus sp.]|nr:hypothetical protein SPONL_80 [uncultured Candidatus Thioglobus sp.]SMN01021.1 hypothetical protein SPONN_2150 [uncultured Candidatus Thioglobus sp.]
MNLKKLFAVALISSAAFTANAARFEDSVGGEKDVFSIFDSNKDGKISMTELVDVMMKVVSMDKDGDHFISMQELQHQENYNHWMAMFDFDKDGKLSASELPEVLHDKMHKMDKNNDGYLSIDELTGEVNIWG